MSDHSFIAEYLYQFFDEVSPKEFYRAVFPLGALEQKGVQEQGKYNGIAVEIFDKRKNGKQVIKRYTITDDLDIVDELTKSNNFIITSPISYIGKSRESKNARYIYGLAIDLDGVDSKQNIVDLVHQMTNTDYIPKATYIVASGSGVHIYYLFKEPIPCFKNITKQLSDLKQGLTKKIWNMYTTTLSNNVQIQSLFQGFRMVGSITKDGNRARAFEIGDKVTIEYLNGFVLQEYQVKNFTYKSKLSLSEAKIKYPQWYEKRIEQKQPKGTWVCKRDLYEWWKARLISEIKEGHRYYGVMCLAVYAKKCGISYDEVAQDAYEMVRGLDNLTTKEDNHFTDYDVTIALEMYNDNYITFPIDSISKVTDIPIKKNKRNYQKQKDHLEEARAIRDIRQKRKGTKWTDHNGRPPKMVQVVLWQNKHPQGTKAECIRETKLSKHTVYKYWNCKQGFTNVGEWIRQK